MAGRFVRLATARSRSGCVETLPCFDRHELLTAKVTRLILAVSLRVSCGQSETKLMAVSQMACLNLRDSRTRNCQFSLVTFCGPLAHASRPSAQNEES
jgi:hypothetical protein